jgi:hypothetical protein
MTNIDPLLHIDYAQYKTGIAYSRALVEADPTINLNRYLRICHYHGLNNVRGYSRCRFHSAVREWRSENGYPIRPAGRRGVSKSANWLPPEHPQEAAESLLTDEETPQAVESAPEAPAPPWDKDKGAKSTDDASGAALAELVWEWMTRHDLEMVAFWDDGEVNVRRKEPKKREFRVVIEGEE